MKYYIVENTTSNFMLFRNVNGLHAKILFCKILFHFWPPDKQNFRLDICIAYLPHFSNYGREWQYWELLKFLLAFTSSGLVFVNIFKFYFSWFCDVIFSFIFKCVQVRQWKWHQRKLNINKIFGRTIASSPKLSSKLFMIMTDSIKK